MSDDIIIEEVKQPPNSKPNKFSLWLEKQEREFKADPEKKIKSIIWIFVIILICWVIFSFIT